MVGAAIVRRLASESCEIITADRSAVDLTRQEAVERWMAEVRPQAIFVAAAKVGGILANSSFPATFLYDNLMIEANVIHAAWRTGVEKLCFLAHRAFTLNTPRSQSLKRRSLEARLSRPTKRMR